MRRELQKVYEAAQAWRLFRPEGLSGDSSRSIVRALSAQAERGTHAQSTQGEYRVYTPLDSEVACMCNFAGTNAVAACRGLESEP